MGKGKFNEAQNHHIQSYFPEFVQELDKGLSGTPLTHWKQGKASKIIETPAFATLDLESLSRKAWFEGRLHLLPGFKLRPNINCPSDDRSKVHQLSEPGISQVCRRITVDFEHQKGQSLAQVRFCTDRPPALCARKPRFHHVGGEETGTFNRGEKLCRSLSTNSERSMGRSEC